MQERQLSNENRLPIFGSFPAHEAPGRKAWARNSKGIPWNEVVKTGSCQRIRGTETTLVFLP